MTQTTGLQVTHGTAELQPGVKMHYVEAGVGPRTVVLLHGYPQTWWEWRHVIPVLAAAGWRVIAPDYRGAGASSKPQEGYDKRTMARDVNVLLGDHLGVKEPIALVGHDIGMMVAYAFAISYPKSVDKLVLIEAPLPGTTAYDALVATPKVRNAAMWHFFFHNADNDLAELLTQGRERQYLQHFFERLAFDQGAIGPADLDVYASAFAGAGAMRAGFEVYRAFDRDGEDNRAALAEGGRLKMPVLGLGGTSSFFLPIAEKTAGRGRFRRPGRRDPALRSLDRGGEPDGPARRAVPLPRLSREGFASARGGPPTEQCPEGPDWTGTAAEDCR